MDKPSGSQNQIPHDLNAVLSTISEAFIVLDENMVITLFNRAAEAALRVSAESVVGKPAFESFPELRGTEVEDEYNRTIAEGKARSFEFYCPVEPYRNWYNVKVFPSGRTLVLYFQIITPSKEAERVAANHEYYLNAILQTTAEAFWLVDKETRIVEANDACCKLLGYSREELLKLTINDIDTIETPQETHDRILRIVRNGSEVFETKHRRKDGSTIQVEVSVTFIDLDGGKLICFSRDTTERKKVENYLVASQDYLKAVLDSINDAVFIDDADTGQIIDVNRGMSLMYGYSRSEALALNIGELSQSEPPYSQVEALEWLTKTREHGPQKFEWLAKHKDGTVFPVEVSTNFVVIGGKNRFVVTVRDFTAQKKAQAALKESEERFRSLYQNASVGIYRTTPDGRVLLANPCMVKMLGFDTFEELALHNLEGDWFLPDCQRHEFKRLLELNGELRGLESVWRVRDKSTIYVLESARMVKDDHEQPIYYEGVVEDITQRKIAEMAQSRSEERVRTILELAPVGIGVLKDRVFMEVNPTLCQMTGYSPEELLGRNTRMLYPSQEEYDYVGVEKIQQIATHGTGMVETHWVRRDCEVIYVLLSTSPIVQGDTSQGIIFTALDITKRRQAEERLQIISKGIEQSPAIMIITDTKGVIKYVNPMFSLVTGYSQEEALGSRLGALSSPTQSDGLYSEIIDNMLSGNEWQGELHSRKRNGEHYWESVRVSPIKNEKGEIISFIIISEDITEKKRAQEVLQDSEKRLKEQYEKLQVLNGELMRSYESIQRINAELERARTKAEESDKLKSAFLANMSHEIRTPMNAIVGFSELLLRPNLSPAKREFYSLILNTSCHQLLSVVDDVIDISKIETGQMALHEEVTSINQVILRVQSIFRPKADELGVELTASFEFAHGRDSVITDSTKLNQILTNLVSNAIKFTDRGTIHVGYTLKADMLEFLVSDTGIGIHPDNHEFIFERFRQVEVESTRKYGGAGLGLSICRALVEFQGGSIWVESELGRGSTFRFTLPYKPSQPASVTSIPIPEENYNFSDRHILIAEDEDANFFYLNELLGGTGAAVSHAADGIMAVEFIQQNPTTDLILMDIKMPRMNGLDATRAIKVLYHNIPIVALTAYAMAGDKQQCIDAGCDGYIAKPIVRQELLQLIRGILK